MLGTFYRVGWRSWGNNRELTPIVMKDSQILSTFMEEPVQRRKPPRVLVFDACHVGVIMRAVLFVEATMMTGAMFGAADVPDWLLRASVLTGAALPATLAWLIVTCSLKGQLERLLPPFQAAFGMALGALAGIYGCGLLRMTG
ncbi:MAG: histidine kinase internal protein, partial [Ramlibacter sp.]|nr:histidine kinase internal protein [Ramlibacter sp.]